MLTTLVKKLSWEKGEEWPEKWYSTQLCFEVFAKNNNPLAKHFAPKGLQVLALNTSWFYEKTTSKAWDSGKNKVASNLKTLENLIKETEVLLKISETLLKNLSKSKKIDEKTLIEIKKCFYLLWSIFLADLGRPLGNVLKKRLKDKGFNSSQIEQVINYCFQFKHQLGYQQEEQSLKIINSVYQKKYNGQKVTFNKLSKEIKSLLSVHSKKFGYLTGTDLDTEPYSPQEFFKKLPFSSNTTKINLQLPDKTKNLLDKNDLKFINLLKRHIYNDNYAADINSKLDFLLNQLISKSFKIIPKELSWYSFQEIEKLILIGKKVENIRLKERKNYRIMCQIDGKIGIFYGRQNYLKIKSIVDDSKPKINVAEFKGMVACRGAVQGQVKIVKTIRDIDKVKTGNILVAINTHPDLMIAIKRCAGIITDYGGITSHAAIVSREFNIPCIVGTSIATQVLKDGDSVYLDAESGIVKVLKQG